MEFLKSQLTRIQEQLGALSASQKMLTGCLVAIMVMTLVAWSHWAAEPEMTSVLGAQSLSPEDLAQITGTLNAQGIPHKIDGDKVMVPTDRKEEILGELGYSQSLPRDLTSAFDDLIKNASMFDPPSKSDQLYLEAKQRTLARMISNFPGVSKAVVMIDPTNDRRIDNTAVQPSAAVTIWTGRNGTANPKKLAESAAYIVSGAEAGVVRSRIKIVIDGIPMTVRDPDSEEGGGSTMEEQRAREDYYRDKIVAALLEIKGLTVSVAVKLNTASSLTTTHDLDPKKVYQGVVSIQESTHETTGGSDTGQESATIANTGVSVPSASAGGSTSSSSETKTDYATDHFKEEKVVKQGPGDATVVSASVRVPRSYFIAAYKTQYGGKDPEEAALLQFSNDQMSLIRTAVKNCTDIASDDRVFVGSYTDMAPMESTAPVQVATSPVSMLLGSHSKEIGVGVLAAMSLFMVSMMVRKSTPAAALPVQVESTEPQTLIASDALAGKAVEGGAMLDGVELDADAVKAQQVLQQVQEMVQTNPDGAASLVKRWLSHA